MSDSVEQLVGRVRGGDVRALARAISLVEAGLSGAYEADYRHAFVANQILSACFPFSSRALRIGITGAPGAGKSTLVDRLARHFREADKTVGVVAVDPTSPFSGGAILGDRIRMQGFDHDPGFYARSMATRGALGGVAGATADVAAVVAASGKDVILIETVGVGQDEVDIVRMADITLVVLVPGMGDDVQSIKAGILEIADVFVINKSDREGAERLEGELYASMGLAQGRELDWSVPVIRTAALDGLGIAELASALGAFQEWLGREGHLQARRAKQWKERLLGMVHRELVRTLRQSSRDEADFVEVAKRVAAGDGNPYSLVSGLVSKLKR